MTTTTTTRPAHVVAYGLERLIELLRVQPGILEHPGVAHVTPRLTIQCSDAKTVEAILRELKGWPQAERGLAGYVGSLVRLSPQAETVEPVQIDVWAKEPKCEACGR